MLPFRCQTVEEKWANAMPVPGLQHNLKICPTRFNSQVQAIRVQCTISPLVSF